MAMGKMGVSLSLMPWLTLALMLLLRPGLRSLTAFLAGAFLMFGPPASLLVNLVALVVDKKKTLATAGFIVSVLTCALDLFVVVCG